MARSSTVPEIMEERYRLVGRVGKGGMGEVYRAKDLVLGRTVAIKVLAGDLAAQADFIERFRREAVAAARLSHPNIVAVHDWGEADPPFMVMEYVRGKTLRRILAARGCLDPREAAEVSIAVLAGLEAAHREGLVHGDIKPENIMVTVDGRVKVADFGIARGPGATIGGHEVAATVAYASPEQIRGQGHDARSDLYSTGCVIYEMLTGSCPFEGDAASVMHAHLNERVPAPSSERAGVPAELDRIVLRATDPDLGRRYADAGAMRADLADALPRLEGEAALEHLAEDLTAEVPADAQETSISRTPARRRRRVWPVLVGVLALAAAAGLVLFRPVRIPALAGGSEGEARQRLRGSGLVLSESQQFSDQAAGTVIGTKPSRGAIALRGETLQLIVSRGPALVAVPALAGMGLNDAKAALGQRRIPLGQVSEVYSAGAPGQILDQDPKAGMVRVGTPVNLTVSRGPEMLAVPDLSGKLIDDASKALSDAGFTPARSDAFDDSPAGTLLSQSPKAGEKAPRGSLVQLVVSKGPQPFGMPSVKGQSCPAAQAQLQGLGLVVTVRSRSGACSGLVVLDQDPLAGSSVRKGDAASLYAG